MTREEKGVIIEKLVGYIQTHPNFYITDTEGLDAEKTTDLRRLCFQKNVKMVVVKNTLLRIALERLGINNEELVSTLIGTTAVMFSDSINAPAKLIKEFGKNSSKPELKSAYVQEAIYVGAKSLESLLSLKTREELIGDIVTLLQSPIKNVVSALQSNAGGKIAGIVKALEERKG